MANIEHRSAASPRPAASLLSLAVAQLIYPYIGEREEDESFTFLPDDIIVTEILPRLHIKPLFRFKCASKRYRSIISHPVFARNYLNRAYKNDNSPKSWSSSGLLATLLYPFTNMSSYGHGLSVNVRELTDTLNFGTLFPDDPVCVSYVSLPYNNSHRIRASSNGLVLSHFHGRSLDDLIDPLCVSNPLTKHCVKLPKPSLELYSVHWELAIATRRVQTGSTFLTYKVVAIERFLDWDEAFATVHIFSSDTGSWTTWKVFCPEGFILPKGCFAYNGILHFLDTDTGISVLTYDPYESPDRFNQIPLPNGRQTSHSSLIFSGDEEMLKYCEVDNTGGSGVDRLTIWRLVHSEWCLEGEFRIPSVVYECRSLMVAPNPWNRDVICHPYVMINKFTVVNPRAGTMKMIRVLDDQTMLIEFYSDLLINYDYPQIPIELCPWSSPCYVSN